MAFRRTDQPDPRNDSVLRAHLRQEREMARWPRTGPVHGFDLDRFVRENLASVMADRGYFGRRPKRIRKKLARKFLRKVFLRKLAEHMAAPLRLRVDYASVGRRVFQVQPLPEPTGLPFYTSET